MGAFATTVGVIIVSVLMVLLGLHAYLQTRKLQEAEHQLAQYRLKLGNARQAFIGRDEVTAVLDWVADSAESSYSVTVTASYLRTQLDRLRGVRPPKER